MISSTLFVRVVAQDRARGFMLLVGYDRAVVQSTAMQYMTLSALTRESLNRTIELVRQSFSCTEVRDVTAEGIKKRLRKMFGENELSKDEVK